MPRCRGSAFQACSPPLGAAQSTLAGGCAQLLSMGCQRASESVHVRRPEIAGDGRSADLAIDCARPRCSIATPSCKSARPSPSPRSTGSGTRITVPLPSLKRPSCPLLRRPDISRGLRYGTVTPTPSTEHRALHTRHTLQTVYIMVLGSQRINVKQVKERERSSTPCGRACEPLQSNLHASKQVICANNAARDARVDFEQKIWG
jgi:hypothetical protein